VQKKLKRKKNPSLKAKEKAKKTQNQKIPKVKAKEKVKAGLRKKPNLNLHVHKKTVCVY
jgi:hypothetical protein